MYENFILDLFFFLFPFYFVFLIDRTTNIKLILNSFGLKKTKLKDFAKKTIFVFFFLFLISYLLSFFSLFFNVSDLELVGNELIRYPFFFIAYLFIIRVFLEEWFFRGFLVPRVGILLSSFIFSVGHIAYGSIIEVIGAFVLGVFLAKMYEKNNNLWPNILAHSLYNFIIYFFLVCL